MTTSNDATIQYNCRLLGLDINYIEFKTNPNKFLNSVHESYHKLIHRWTPPEELSTSVFVDLKQYEEKRNQISKAYNELLLLCNPTILPAPVTAPVLAQVTAPVLAPVLAQVTAPVNPEPVLSLSYQPSIVYIPPIKIEEPTDHNGNRLVYYMKLF